MVFCLSFLRAFRDNLLENAAWDLRSTLGRKLTLRRQRPGAVTEEETGGANSLAHV